MNQFITLFIRNIRNNPKLFLINVTSFSIGIVAVLFITLFVVKEFRADRFHGKHKDIYRLLLSSSTAPVKYPETQFPLGKLLQNNHPEIQEYTRFRDISAYQITIGDHQFHNQKISSVDRSFFSIFDFKLKIGDVNLLFEQPNTIVIDQNTAKRYFNSIDVVGKTFSSQIHGEGEKKVYTIVGLLDDYPEESTLQPNLIIDIKSEAEDYEERYFVLSPQLFLYIPKCKSPQKMAEAFSATFNRKYNDLTGRNEPVDNNRYSLQQLTNIYLHSTDVSGQLPKGDYLLVWVLTGIGVILLVVTFMNYLILTLGASLKNQKQNQIRTILGSGTSWLKMKYASESVFYSLITFVVALFLFPVVHRIISSFTEIRYGIFSGSDPKIVVLFLLALILIGASIGYLQYSILFQRKFKNTQLASFKTRKPFFSYLIQFQLLIFIVIISSVILVNRQMQFIQRQDKGYDLKNTIPVTLNDDKSMELFIQECNKHSFIKHTSVGHNMFCNTIYLHEITIERSNEIVKSQYIWGDNNYIDTYNIQLLYGKNIEGDKLPPVRQWWKYPGSNDVMDILVNEEFVRKSGLENPLGTIVTINNNGTSRGQICGVIADVKNSTFYHAVTPMVIGFGISHMPSIIVSVQEGHLEEFKTMVNDFFIKIGKDGHMGYQTWNFDYEVWYHKEQVLIRLLSVLSFVLLAILLLGIYGTSMFISETKTKEIGIRKVNGAKVSEILTMLNKDFVRWVIIAFVIATPIAYYAMNKWLENFAYKTELSWWIFALAGLLALGIALLTVSWQSWRAATRNPVEALRYE